jgi:uncharacterized membrane protein
MASRPNDGIGRVWIGAIAAIVAVAASAPADAAQPAVAVRNDLVAVRTFAAAAGAADTPPSVALRGYLRDKRGRFTTIQPAGATGSKLGDINNRGEIVGAYPDTNAVHNFVRDRRGRYTTFDLPGAPGTAAGVGDINDRGQIVSFYPDGAGTYRSFLRSGRGAFTGIENPGAGGTSPYGSGTAVYGINDRGVMVGAYAAGGTVHGFVRDRKGEFTTIDYPGAAETTLLEINERGQIVGSYGDDVGDGLSRDFVLDHGDYTAIEFPGAPESYVDDVNNRGQIVGYYLDEAGAYHGYLRDRRGRYSPIDHPAAVAPGNDTAGLNDRGRIVGQSYDDVDAGTQKSALSQGGLGAGKRSPSLLSRRGLLAG